MATQFPRTRSLRDEQVRLSRAKVLAAARLLFLERGYSGTTVEAVADEAGVSIQTVYNTVGAKAVLLKTVYDVAIAGDDEPVAMADRPGFLALAAETDGRRFLARYARLGREMSERVGPLLAVLLGQVGGAPDLQAWIETIDGERAVGTSHAAQRLAELVALRPGRSAQDAADLLWALTAPETAVRLVFRRDWSWDAYERWLAEAMTDALLGPAR
jgi:AcrR family transcriptional regulator